ncbi:hypothetical protein [Hymenobacter yonginensis]|uniref:DUF3408 domain-containing protein n=1 Tax=Hymenobacter yonginensis TaxID=748197 RepID=A0ABY7PV20_9BACT|nr:hypothetical protein [Hymenobacter yonginensis]WBO86783.1 hypothetical protein O9Z63_20065 [Hymenobacter yonginensis]
MAKSFKQLSSGTAQPTKRTSEIDLLDFLEQDRQTTAATPEPAVAAAPAAAPVTDSSGSTAPAKPGRRPAAAPAAPEAAAPARKAPGRPKAVAPARPTPVTESADVTDVTSVTAATTVAEAAVGTAATGVEEASDSDVRQTFVLSRQYLEKLKNFVHTQRMGGQYDFTQKQALHQALDLLFDNAEIEERPLQIRQKEEVRRQQIRKGRGR